MYVTGTSLAAECGVEGYYVRVSEPDEADAASPRGGFVPIKNRPPSESCARAALTIAVDALALVRFGIRAADDPRIVDTVRVIDALLKVATPRGPAWHRYNGDGYGEHADGAAFDGVGIGRAWPLLVGERGHYELAAGRPAAAEELARAMQSFAGSSLLLPEQVWETADIPERELFLGQASGSARPLVWAHSEFLKLRRSIADAAVFDRPPQAFARYVTGGKRSTPYAVWKFNNKIRAMAAGKILRVETLAPAVVHCGVDGWQHVQEVEAADTGLGVFVADLPTTGAARSVEWTFYWPDARRWEGADFTVTVKR
jgi:glucoamylase